jgi:glutamate decarboxylase
VHQAARDVATYLSERVSEIAPFRLITDGSELPVFAFEKAGGSANYSVFDVSKLLREGGWLVPAYQFPANRDDVAALRVVVRNGFTRDLADLFLADLERCVAYLDKLDARLPAVEGEVFHH